MAEPERESQNQWFPGAKKKVVSDKNGLPLTVWGPERRRDKRRADGHEDFCSWQSSPALTGGSGKKRLAQKAKPRPDKARGVSSCVLPYHSR